MGVFLQYYLIKRLLEQKIVVNICVPDLSWCLLYCLCQIRVPKAVKWMHCCQGPVSEQLDVCSTGRAVVLFAISGARWSWWSERTCWSVQSLSLCYSVHWVVKILLGPTCSASENHTLHQSQIKAVDCYMLILR